MIYLDNFATTPMDDIVKKSVISCMCDIWGNPHSVTHKIGWQSGDMLDSARRTVAQKLGAKPHEVIFTSGATESNNTVIKSVPKYADKTRKTLLISAVEHPCIRQSAVYMQQFGYTVQEIPVLNNGLIDVNAYKDMLNTTVALVSIMLVNNELGTIQDLKPLIQSAHAVGAVFHTDIAQAVGKVPVLFKELGADFMSVSGHKIYGPKGIGALIIKQGVSVTPLLHGGGQEYGVRSGTVATPLIVGLATAVDLAVSTVAQTHKIENMRNTLEQYICKHIPTAVILGKTAPRVAGASNIYVAGVYADDFFTHLSGVAVSSGSACASAGKGMSPVMRAIGIDPQTHAVSIRICVGRLNSTDDIKTAGHAIVNALKKCM